MIRITKTISITAILILCGCQTMGRTGDVRPITNGSTSLKFSVNQVVARGTNQLNNTLNGTLSGYNPRKSAIGFVYPRTDAFPLGTVLRQKIGKGHSQKYDVALAEEFKDDIQTVKVDSALLSGMMNHTSRRMILLPHKRDEIYKDLLDPNRKGYVQMSTVAHIKQGRIEYLPQSVPVFYANKRLPKVNANDRLIFSIADKLIWAKEISYFIRPNQILKNTNKKTAVGIWPEELETAKQNNVDVRNINGVTVITEKFEQEKIVAVGFSIFPDVTKYGDNSIKHNAHPTLADIIFAKAEPAKVLN